MAEQVRVEDSGAVRTVILSRPAARNAVDGPTDDDRGLSGTGGASQVVPNDPQNAIVYGRTPGQVLNILFQSANAVTKGGFFPNGIKGTIATSDGDKPAS